ncbi:MAG: acetyl-CoA C-acetyltransferase [Thermoanaerobaculia bacterium]|nr:acetyl-CoA C-acetyltransferase [Thermoanaerobaculia bacterium]
MQDVVILSAARTPVGSFQGALAPLPAHTLGARALAGAFERAGVEPGQVDQVYMGCVLTAGQGQAPARQATLGAGCPTSTGAITLNKVCGSGMRAVMSASNDLRCGDFSIAAAGGMESMSNAPYLARGARDGLRLGHGRLIDSMIHDGLWDPYNDQHMGNCAEACVREYSFTREAQDDYARESYERARRASKEGIAEREIVPVEVPRRKGDPKLVERDEEPFRADLEKMPKLRPAFEKEGTVTAANASKINDGAAALVLTTADRAGELGLEPIARIVAHATTARDPEWFTTAPIGSTRAVLERAGLTVEEIDLFEINEAFAAVAMAAMEDLEIPHEKLNVLGGAVALGHPIGASGARILVTLLNALEQRDGRLGCAAICLGGGEATAMIVERLG